MVRRQPIFVLALATSWLATAVALAGSADVAFSFAKDGTGGVALVRVDTASGKIAGQAILLQSSDCQMPLKVRRTRGGQTTIVTNLAPKGPHVFLVPGDQSRDGERIRLSDVPDELRIVGDHALVTCADDSLAWIDLVAGRVEDTWDAEKELKPPGNGPEDILVAPDGKLAVVSFQKDSEKGKKKGSRLAVVTLPDLKTVADIQLPRDRPQLHIDGNLKEQGPCPEVLLLSEQANKLLVTLDLYGAVALMDWSGVRSGQLVNCRYVSTSLDGTWGGAFPDRAALIPMGPHPYAIVCNAGVEGGAVLVDVPGGQVVQRWNVPAGLEQPVYVPKLSQAFSVCSGKTKRREGANVERTFRPAAGLYCFDFRNDRDPKSVPMTRLPLELLGFALAVVDLGGSPLLVLAVGRERADTLVTYDPVRREIRDQQPAVGIIARFEG
jgi:hypothetical protein